MVDGRGSTRGGLVAALADSAFAFACNSHGHVTAAASFEISYVEPGRLGDRLVAACVERSSRDRSGTHDVTVRRERR